MFEKIISTMKEIFGETNEFVRSTQMALEERITSPFYGYFFVSWFLWNWQLFYVALFLDQKNIFEKTGLLRNEYLISLFPTSYSFEFWLRFFIGPLLLTVFFFWLFPYGTRLFFRKSIKNQNALKIIELQESQKETREEKGLVKEETALIKEKIEKAKEEKKAEIETPEVLWEKEFVSLFENNSDEFSKLEQLQEHAYGNSYLADWQIKAISFFHVIGLFTFESGKQLINLTDKGKFFLKRFIETRKGGNLIPF
ncbi:MAG: hypothetical protein Greene07147_18 [Parcubacteria group bacterium Greene0714_7]|nr:MAG: hypothetical protein Greene07147_18 [Parcubacteria group bacterium Greene0714_7]